LNIAARPSKPLDPESLRREFPALHQTVNGHPLAYLDNAATTQKPRCVLEAITRFYERDNANVHRATHELATRATAGFEAARARVGRFLNAREASEIVFARGATEALNLVARAWAEPRLRPGDQILLTPLEHHSNLVPWQQVAARTGARLRFLPLETLTPGADLDARAACLTPEVKLLAFTHVSNVTGMETPAARLCAEARRRGIVTVVDAAQSAAHLPLDVQGIGCDFLAFSGHKTCGPTGIGVLYGRRERLEAMDPWQGGGEMIERVDLERSTFAPPPQRFEAGTPDISGAIGLAAAIEFLDALGRPAIAAHSRDLAQRAARGLATIPGVRLLGPVEPRIGVVAFEIQGVHAHDVAIFANEQGIALRAGHHCAQPLLRELGVSSAVRASFHCYNTAAEADRLIEVVRQAGRFFA
jgi:cysteine desulfurase/selenocysteine lyase